jgi:hypothetical protein
MTLTLAPTGSALGNYEELLGRHEAAGAEHTPLGEIVNPALAAALRSFVAALSEPMAALRSFIGDVGYASVALGGSPHQWIPDSSVIARSVFSLGTATEVITLLEPVDDRLGIQQFGDKHVLGTDDLLQTIRGLQDRLGISLDDVLDAAGISKSTFYSWGEKPSTRPRVASQGRIWAMAQSIDDLEALLGSSARAWVLSDPSRRELLQAGRFDALLELVRSERPDTYEPPAHADNYAVGPEPDRMPQPAVRPGVSRSVHSVPARGRRKR